MLEKCNTQKSAIQGKARVLWVLQNIVKQENLICWIPCFKKGLVLVPTRELALQTSSVVKELGKHMNIQCMVIIGK